jgi:hypothetical protein
MTNRRQFIRSGVALSVVSSPALSAFPGVAFATAATTLGLEHCVFDNRFAFAVAVAQHAARAGVRPAETSGDLTALWYDRLDLEWTRTPTALGGVTTQPGLFVLETLAADYGMRVIYRGRHGVPEDGVIAHSLTGPAALVAQLRAGSRAPDCARRLADAMTQCPIGAAAVQREFTTPAEPAVTHSEPLFSWIIAPRFAAARTA